MTSTSFPGSSLFLPRESTLVSAGHVAPKIWVLTRMCYRGGVAKCKIVTSVRMVESTGGDVSFFRNMCGDKNSFYRQVFLHYIRSFDIEVVHVVFDSEKHVYKSLNFKTLSLMRRSIRNFNIPPPGIPRAFDCASCSGRGEFERCVGRVGNLNRIYLLF